MMTCSPGGLIKSFKRTALLLCLIMMLAFLGGCGSSDSSTPASDPALVVSTQYGDVRGFEADANTYQWRGIPYAAPPVGDLRWRPPQDHEGWSGVRDATEYGPQAPQSAISASFGLGGVSEDCLNLNITAPKNASDLPVMVWLHGGFFSVLTANNGAYNNPDGIPSRDVVLVTINHRLGPLGYIAHPWLSAEELGISGESHSGNYGQMDLVKALEWVQTNISNFGGNPDEVTIFGESGGGTKVLSLMTASETWVSRNAPPFQKAICQSGIAADTDKSIRPWDTLASAEANGEKFVALLETNLGRSITSLDDLRALTWEEIIDNAPYQDNFQDDATTITYAPNVDGHYMTQTFQQAFDAAAEVQVPFIAGTTEGDGRYLTPGYVDLMLNHIAPNHTAPVYAYVFKQVPYGWRTDGVKAYHGIDLAYLFNSTASFPVHVAIKLPQLTVDFCDPDNVTLPDIQIDQTEFDMVSDYMITMWTNFAITGDPSYTGGSYEDGPAWGPFTTNDQYLEIGTSLTMQNSLSDSVFPDYPACP